MLTKKNPRTLREGFTLSVRFYALNAHKVKNSHKIELVVNYGNKMHQQKCMLTYK